MTNTRDLDPPRWCGDLNNQKTGGCGAYYSMGASGLVRFCYNPTHPEINNGVKCKPTEPIICPPSAPPSPPPAVASPPPTAANKIGYLSSMQMGAYEYRNVHELGGCLLYTSPSPRDS